MLNSSVGLIEVSRNIAVLNDILFQFKLSKSDVEIAQQIHYVWGGIVLEKGPGNDGLRELVLEISTSKMHHAAADLQQSGTTI